MFVDRSDRRVESNGVLKVRYLARGKIARTPAYKRFLMRPLNLIITKAFKSTRESDLARVLPLLDGKLNTLIKRTILLEAFKLFKLLPL